MESSFPCVFGTPKGVEHTRKSSKLLARCDRCNRSSRALHHVLVKLSLLALLATSSLASAGTAPEHRGPGRVVVTDTSCEILGPIVFLPNDARVAPSSPRMLRAVADTMLGNPSIALMEVEGFADASETSPELLGLARATSVMAVLVADGVPMYRLQAGSLGATQPLDKTAQHPEKNRRIEFLIVRRDS